jgi:Mrp family chromosome partitioning ATPase
MSRAYDALKKFEATSGPVFEKTVEKITEEGGIIKFPELAIETSPEAAREYEQLYENILLLGGKNLRAVMVCGPQAGEGATTMALTLAAFVAMKKSLPVLLVEANLRVPTFYRYVRGNCREGFCDFLLNQGRVNNYVMKSTVPNLSTIAAGRVNGEGMDRFSYSQIKGVVQECLSGYPFVVFDSMPATDYLAAEVASCVDGVVMVLKSATPMKVAMAAKDSLERAGGRILGVVVNQYNR